MSAHAIETQTSEMIFPATTSIEIAWLLLEEARAQMAEYYFWHPDFGWLSSVTGEPWQPSGWRN